MTATRRPPQFFTVPSGTPISHCRSCGADMYYVSMPSGASNPIDCDPARVARLTEAEPAFPPTPYSAGKPGQHGRGVTHFMTCPQAAEHRRPRMRKETR